MSNNKKPLLVFFKEILVGDLRKQNAISNDSATGGGARDMRIPVTVGEYLKPFFPEQSTADGVRRGIVQWEEGPELVSQAEIELWRPTAARPSENRIACIHRLTIWKISDEPAFLADLKSSRRWFYILIKSDDNLIWASIMTAEHFSSADHKIKRAIEHRIEKTSANRAVNGVFDYVSGSVHP